MLPNRVKHGMTVTVPVKGPLVGWRRNKIEDHSGTWEVLDKAPGGVTSWWIHRTNAAGRWESVKVDADMMEEQAPRIEWDATAPLNPKVRAGSYSTFHTDKGYANATGWIAGEYGTHNPGAGFLWTITHIPTGLSVFRECYNMADAKALLTKLGELDCLFPGLGFGDSPTDKVALSTLKAILKPELVEV